MAKPGNLIYVIGPSGAGKDSLIDFARKQLPTEHPVIFAHRYITRERAGGEDHVPVSSHEFKLRQSKGCFAMDWEANGLQYGLGVELHQWMEAGLSVVVNGSRGYLDQALKRFKNLYPVLIDVDLGVLRQRLVDRGREDEPTINSRLERARAYAEIPNIAYKIQNNGALDEAGHSLIDLIKQVHELEANPCR